MADSDNTTTLPFVTRPDEAAKSALKARARQFAALSAASLLDPAASLALRWLSAHTKTQALCIKQQQLESVLDGGNGDCHRDYMASLRAENRAALAERALLDKLPKTPAQTIDGIVGKLMMILGECDDNTDAADFPGPHVRSVLDDIRRLAGQGHVGVEAQAARSTT